VCVKIATSKCIRSWGGEIENAHVRAHGTAARLPAIMSGASDDAVSANATSLCTLALLDAAPASSASAAGAFAF